MLAKNRLRAKVSIFIFNVLFLGFVSPSLLIFTSATAIGNHGSLHQSGSMASESNLSGMVVDAPVGITHVNMAQIEAWVSQLESIRLMDLEQVAVETDKLLPLLHQMPLVLQYRFVLLKAQSWAMNGEMKSAQKLLQTYLDKTPPESLIAEYVNLLVLLAGVYSDLDEVVNTLQVLNQIVPYLERVDDVNNEAYVYMLMVEMLSRMTRDQAAQQYTGKLYATLNKVIKPIRRCYISTIHANAVTNLIEHDINQRDHLVRLFTDAYHECELANDNGTKSINLRSLTHIYLLDNRLISAKKSIDEAYQMALADNNTSELGFIYVHLADIAKREGKLIKAEKYALQSFEIATELGTSILLIDASLMLSDTYEALDNTTLALFYRKAYEAASLTRMQDIKGQLTVFESAKLQLLDRERQLDLLEREKALYLAMKKMTDRTQTQMHLWMTLLIGCICFLIIWVFISVRQKGRYQVLAQSDPLTGIYNRSAGEYVGKILYRQARKEQRQFSLVSFDIDDFKNINDRFGHGTGDWVLKKIVAEINPLLGLNDIFVRMGGEEFMILLPDINEAAAWEKAAACRLALASMNTQYSGHQFSVTASFGVTQAIAPDHQLDTLVERADEAIYFSQMKVIKSDDDFTCVYS
ncbi:GGDEF domain-containing protein [Shewanella surugensis]|uniref:diguanylate cyclase n=1 Tax=Shewanella surugensis TaxID=212020 RepID=A0ABT0L757_9GAMM|nr:tetratricopeptide repeat-containing diguanylate cyclase [Shewanella surugensis]MCL1123506.1 diguanylate cyclase [Shewanella surugensis]